MYLCLNFEGLRQVRTFRCIIFFFPPPSPRCKERKAVNATSLGPCLRSEPGGSSVEGGWGGCGTGEPKPSLGRTDGWCCFLIHQAGFRGGPLGERVRGEKAGSAGTNRLRSGPDACRTMGLLKEMREEAWRALCAASALQVGMGQLRFNEVHS